MHSSVLRFAGKHKKSADRKLSADSQWLGWKDLNPRNDGVRVRCLTPWRHPNRDYLNIISHFFSNVKNFFRKIENFLKRTKKGCFFAEY